MSFSTPILLIVFNRPDVTRVLLEKIKCLAPAYLYIAADGPRPNNEFDPENCSNTRNIFEKIDWECKVEKLFRDKNLGCKIGVSSAIDWFFENVEEGIILEDDCIPDLSFFGYCQQLLQYYREDQRIYSVSGTNILGEWKPEKQDYHFSHHVSVWGWATWRRAWKHFDIEMKDWSKPEVKKHIELLIGDKRIYGQKAKFFDATQKGEIDTWDHQWAFAHYHYSAFSIIPSVNLISNIGFGTGATHTKLFYDGISAKEVKSVQLPLTLNTTVIADKELERLLINNFTNLTFKNLFKRKYIRSVFDYIKSLFMKNSFILKL